MLTKVLLHQRTRGYEIEEKHLVCVHIYVYKNKKNTHNYYNPHFCN